MNNRGTLIDHALERQRTGECFFGERLMIMAGEEFVKRRASGLDPVSHLFDQEFQANPQILWRQGVDLNGEIGKGKARSLEMFTIGAKLPEIDFLQHLRHVWQHPEQHDRFIEMIEIISRKKSIRIDRRPLQSSAIFFVH